MTFTTTDKTGTQIDFKDAKRYWWLIAYFSASIITLTVILYVTFENIALLFIPLVYFFIVIPLADALLGEDPYNPPDDVLHQMSIDPYYIRLVRGLVLVTWFNLGLNIWFVASYDLPVWLLLVYSVSIGYFAAGSIMVAHELGHKTNKTDQWLAKIELASVGYGHFCVEHNRGHHVQVATPEDPASAKMNESIYRFALREIPGACVRGWQIEKFRLNNKNRSVWSWRNDILQSYSITFAVFLLATLWGGWPVLTFLIIQSIVGWYGLSQANYVEHYGLLRQKLPDGRYERCEPRHSWNTNHIFSNLSTFHLQRHSDHHSNPLRPYQALRSFEDLPRLPSGYPGCFALAAIPPLWYRVMNPKVIEWAGGDFNKINRLR